ncbi:MAG: hypothetical protein MUE53_08255, partial [Chitinophagales bacterium]|nr:hypothetical protein [Chitinophagales bacterium]
MSNFFKKLSLFYLVCFYTSVYSQTYNIVIGTKLKDTTIYKSYNYTLGQQFSYTATDIEPMFFRFWKKNDSIIQDNRNLNFLVSKNDTFIACYSFGQRKCWLDLKAGLEHTMLLRYDGTVVNWGDNGHGEVGRGQLNSGILPGNLNSDKNWYKINSGNYTSFLFKTNGTYWACGINVFGHLGGNNSTAKIFIPTNYTNLNNFITIESRGHHTLGIKHDSTLWVWGHNQFGQLGKGVSSPFDSTPAQITSLNKVLKVFPGFDNSFVLKSDSSLWAFGRNAFGGLGDGSEIDKFSPVLIDNNKNIKKVSSGLFHSILLRTNGTIWSTGRNIQGELGNNTYVNKTNFNQIGLNTDWVDISTGNEFFGHTLAKKNNGSIWAWGYNQYGQLGDGSLINRNNPVQIGNQSDWDLISAGGYFSVATKNDGSVWAWGRNNKYQLGSGNNKDTFLPFQIISNSGCPTKIVDTIKDTINYCKCKQFNNQIICLPGIYKDTFINHQYFDSVVVLI